MKKNYKAFMVTVLFFVLIFSVPVVANAALAVTKLGGVWEQKSSIWNGMTHFFSNGLRRDQTAARTSKITASPERFKKAAQLQWLELDRKFEASRLIAASA